MSVVLQCSHLKHVLWNTFSSATNSSTLYTLLSHEEHFGAFTGTHFLALGADAASAAVIVAVGRGVAGAATSGLGARWLWAGPRLREEEDDLTRFDRTRVCDA